MFRFILLFALVFGLMACNGVNPLMDETATNPNDDGTGGGGNNDGTDDPVDPKPTSTFALPGSKFPSPNKSIRRREARDDGSDTLFGNGFAEKIRYDADSDQFFVDNIAFDGDASVSGYTRVTGLTDMPSTIFGVFESPATAVDTLTLASINQLVPYRALYGVSPSGDATIGIVRTGAYIQYGFGGFVYQRKGGVELPRSGQARYTGAQNYVGLRDFNGRGGLEYVVGDISVDIDFDDFNSGGGVKGNVSNRRVYNMDGDDITQSILDAIGVGVTALPTVLFRIGPDVADKNGEISGDAYSVNPIDNEYFEEGTYYAVLSGKNAKNIAGIVVITASDPRFTDVTVRETAGFFAVRQ